MNVWHIVIGLNIIAIVAAIILALLYRRKFSGIKHYEKVRDKVTIREPKKKLNKDDYIPSLNLGNLLGGFIVILIGINLIPTVAEQANMAANTTDISPITQNLLGTIPTIFILSILISVILIILHCLKVIGLV